MLQSFHIHMDALFDILQSTASVIAGGFALNCYKPFCSPETYTGDMDIIIPLYQSDSLKITHRRTITIQRWTDGLPDSLRNTLARFREFLAVHNYAECQEVYNISGVPQTFKDGENAHMNRVYDQVHRIMKVVSFGNGDKRIQLVFIEYWSAPTFVRTFDLSCCQVFIAGNRSLDVRALYKPLTDAGYTVLLKYAKLEEDPIFLQRVIKYNSRGYTPVSHIMHHFRHPDITVLPDINHIMYDIGNRVEGYKNYFDAMSMREILFYIDCEEKGYPQCGNVVEEVKEEIRTYLMFLHQQYENKISKDVLEHVIGKYI